MVNVLWDISGEVIPAIVIKLVRFLAIVVHGI